MVSVYNKTWTEKAIEALKKYLDFIGFRKEFLIEDFGKWAIDNKLLEEPVINSKWGSFTKEAARQDLISCHGVGIPKHRKASNGRIVRTWVRY